MRTKSGRTKAGLRWIALALAFCVVSLDARAQEAAPFTPTPTPTLTTGSAAPAQPPFPKLQYQPRVWYGYQILLSDAASLGLGLFAAAVSDGSDRQQQGDAVAITWGAGMVGASAVHAAHRNSALGLGGLSSRLALPPFGALLGIATNCIGKPDRPCSADGARFGFAIGLGSAVLLDSLVFSSVRPPADNSATRNWYGWKTLFIDGAALAAGISVAIGQGDADRTKTGAALFVIPYTAGILVAPWMHVFHGRIGLAFASLGLRAIGPGIGAIAGLSGFCAASGSEKRCIKEGAIYGFFFGTLLTAAIDIGVLSYERAPSPATARNTTIMPFIAPANSGATAGITGTL